MASGSRRGIWEGVQGGWAGLEVSEGDRERTGRVVTPCSRDTTQLHQSRFEASSNILSERYSGWILSSSFLISKASFHALSGLRRPSETPRDGTMTVGLRKKAERRAREWNMGSRGEERQNLERNWSLALGNSCGQEDVYDFSKPRWLLSFALPSLQALFCSQALLMP